MYVFHNMIEQLHDDGLFPKKKAIIKNFDNIQLLDRKFPLHSFSAPHKWGMLKSKEVYAHLILYMVP